MEHCIVYFSTWRQPFFENDLITTLEESRQNNAVDGITSVTLYVRGNIIQVIEGAKEAVEALYERIERDQRHYNLIKILSRPIQERSFKGSLLGYETITERQLEELKTIAGLEAGPQSRSESTDGLILKIIKVFYESNRFNS